MDEKTGDASSHNSLFLTQIKSELLAALREQGACDAGVAELSTHGFQSCAVTLFSYHESSERGRGTIAKYARGLDYHIVLKERLEQAARQVLSKLPDVVYQAAVDISQLNERQLAYKAGLGFIGKNGLLIHPVHGSFVFIGTLSTSLPLPPDGPLDKTCLACGRCLSACPGGALSEEGFVPERCLSHISQTKQISKEQEHLLKCGNYIWGCDICQDVCPHNEAVLNTNIPEFKTGLIRDLDGIQAVNFKKNFKNRAFSWRGSAILERNQRIVLQKGGKNNG